MIPKKPAPDVIGGEHRFSEKIMLHQQSMIPKSGPRFSEKIMLRQQSMIPKSGPRFSEKIMLHQ